MNANEDPKRVAAIERSKQATLRESLAPGVYRTRDDRFFASRSYKQEGVWILEDVATEERIRLHSFNECQGKVDTILANEAKM